MSERNEQMARLLAADAPASRDLAFEVAVATRLEQERFRRELGKNAVLALTAALLLAVLMPGLEAIWRANFAIADAAVLAATLFAFAVLAQRWIVQRA